MEILLLTFSGKEKAGTKAFFNPKKDPQPNWLRVFDKQKLTL